MDPRHGLIIINGLIKECLHIVARKVFWKTWSLAKLGALEVIVKPIEGELRTQD